MDSLDTSLHSLMRGSCDMWEASASSLSSSSSDGVASIASSSQSSSLDGVSPIASLSPSSDGASSASSASASASSPTGSNVSTPKVSDAALPSPQVNDMAVSQTPVLSRPAPLSVATGMKNTTMATSVGTDGHEIIDLCSESVDDDDDDDDAAAAAANRPVRPPPRKKAKLDIVADTGHRNVETQAPGPERPRAGLLERSDGQDEDVVKEENSPGAETPTPMEKGVWGVIDWAPKDGQDAAPAGDDDEAARIQLRTGKTPDHVTTTPPPTDSVGAEIIIPIDDGRGVSARPHPARPHNIIPVPRTETIRTKTGTKTTKMVGPFILDEDERVCSPEDEGYGSFNSALSKLTNGEGGQRSGLVSEPAFGSLNVTLSPPKESRFDDLELYLRRKQSEDKCAEMSRRMREEAVAKRKSYMQEDQHVDLSVDFLEDFAAQKWKTRSRSSRMGIQTTTNPRAKFVFPDQCGSRKSNFADEEHAFGRDDPSPEVIEAQLDIAEAFANGNSDGAYLKQLSRSCSSSTSASGREQADRVAEAGSREKDRDCSLQGTTPHPAEQLPNGGVSKKATSGSELYDMKRAEKYWRKVIKEERKKQVWPEKRETERDRTSIVAPPRGHHGPASMMNGACGEAGSRLMAAKGTLRTAPNVDGGLTQLAKSAEKRRAAAAFDDLGDHPWGSGDAYRLNSSVQRRERDDHSFKKSLWRKEASLKERKTDIENLMNALAETAKCWCVAFDSVSPRCQRAMKSEARELKGYIDPILRGYTLIDKTESRISKIKSNMNRRARKYQDQNRPGSTPAEHQIELIMVEFMGPERFQRGKRLLDKILIQYREHMGHRKNTTRPKRRSSLSASNISVELESQTFPSMSYVGVEEIASGSDKADRYERLNLSRQKQEAWQREDAKIKQIKETLARFEEIGEPTRQGESPRKVRFADEDLWDNEHDRAQVSESVESDEDEDETAPSFGRGDGGRLSMPSDTSPVVAFAEPARKEVGGKGLLSQLRKAKKATGLSPISGHLPIAEKRLPYHNVNAEVKNEGQSAWLAARNDVAGKSVSLMDEQETENQLTTESEGSVSQASQHDTEGSCSNDDDGVMDNDMHILHYDVVADYESFDDYQDAKSVPLGRHIDIKAALTHMNRVTTEIAGLASRKHRQLRLIWDTDDFELVAQSIILPTGGECRVRMLKLLAPAANWPGKQQVRARVTPKVFYIVHETKTTSLWPAANPGDEVDDELFGLEDFEDPQAVVEKERDMCFSSRQCANRTAENRFVTFRSRHDGAENAEGTGSTTELAEYMEQIEHDRVCFDRAKRFWIKTKEARKGKEEIKVWVEEMIADMPHI